MFQFQYILLLSLLGLIPLMLIMFFYAKKKKKNAIKKIGDPALVKQLIANFNSASFIKKFLLITFAMGVLVLGVANLRSSAGSEIVNRNGIDVMIALDVSNSMLAQDIRPTRIDRAKQLLSRLVDRMSNDRIGIVIFAGRAYLQMPLTADHASAKMYLSAASPKSVPTQGTVIEDALKMCYASFNSKEKKYKAVILISDGEDHDEGAIKTASQMAAEGVVINTIGMGSFEGAPIMDETTGQFKKDAAGNTVITRLNEEGLGLIASKGNGKYQLFTNTEEVVANLTSQLANMDQRSVKDDSLVNYRSFSQYFLAFALILLLLELFIAEIKRNPRMTKTAMTASLFLFTFSGIAQSEKVLIKEGNDAYKRSDYPLAVTNYEKAVQKNSANPAAQYNLGNALYKSEKKEEAINAYEVSIQQLNKPVEKSNAHYNKGVVLHNDKKLPECIAAYKTALKLDPANEDARQNLQKALKQQKEQQKKDQKEKDKQDEKKDKSDSPKPQPSKLTKKDAEEKLKALMQQEKNLQDKLHKVNAASVNKPEKDW